MGVSAGMWGGLRGVEQLQMVFQYRQAHLFSTRVFLAGITQAFVDGEDTLKDPALTERLRAMVSGFVGFASRNRREVPTQA